MRLEKIRYALGDIVAQYLVDRESDQVSLQLLPAGVEDCYEARRSVALTQEYDHAGFTVPAWGAGSLCHLALDGFPQSTGAGGVPRSRATASASASSAAALRLRSSMSGSPSSFSRLRADISARIRGESGSTVRTSIQ